MLNKEIKNAVNREIRAFNKTITSSTPNKEIWNKKVEISNKYGLEIIGQYERNTKYLSLRPLGKNRDTIWTIIEPEAVETEPVEIISAAEYFAHN